MPKYVLCPRCELNYILEEQEYCDVCKAQLKKGPQLLFAVDDEEDDQDLMELCPKCHQNYLKPGQTLCRQCAKLSQYEEEHTDLDDDSWKEYLDDAPEEEEKDSEEMLSLAKLAEEEGCELFDDEEEEEIEMVHDDEPDDFNYDVDEADFEEDEEEEEEPEEEEDDL